MLRALFGLILLGLVGYGAFAYFWGVPAVPARSTATDAATIEDGRYLAAAADCVSCHTADGGSNYTGGRPFDTPFGRLYSPNITPDTTTGIGGMSSAAFYQIMAYGADSVVAPLYPAMPYTSFHLVSRDDSDAIHAYIMSLDPVVAQKVPNELRFPFNIRPLMFGWNLLFAERGPFVRDPAKDDVWNRGAYLATGLGHCGECHTPRNALGAMEPDAPLAGAVVGEFEAPDLTPQALTNRGWTRDHLVLYFETGASPEGSAFGEMFLAVKNSLSLLTHDDRVAIATYLMDGAADEPSHGEATVAALGDAAHENAAGQALYLSNCSLCHGADGAGIANTMPGLLGNATLAQPDGVNLVRVMANGLAGDHLNQTTGYGPMPAFQNRLTVAEFVSLTNYVRDVFAPNGASLAPLTEAEISAILNP